MRRFMLAVLAIALPVSMVAQTSVRGVIVDASGAPIAGAGIYQQGQPTNGAISGLDGAFTLNVNPDAVLTISCIGYTTVNVPVNRQTSLRITLTEDHEFLDEVMVIAYGSIRKSAFTGSAVAVDNEKLKTPSASFDKALAGQVAGVQVVSQSGQPGSGTSIRVRGSGSLKASNEPLYVVDGVALTYMEARDYSYLADYMDASSNPLASINPNDIESITILKDAAAAALYGSRAANGVVLITTKSGKYGAAKVSFNAQLTLSNLSKAYKMVNSAEYYKLLFDGYLSSGYTVEEANARTQGALTHNPYNVSNPLDANGSVVSGAGIVVNTDWQDEVFSTALTQDYSVNVSGGTDRTDYFFSAGYTDQDGIAPAGKYKRYSGKLNVNTQATPWLKLGLNASYAYSIQNTTVAGSAGASPLYNAIAFPNAVPVYIVDDNGNSVLDADGNKQFNFSNPVSRDFNPLSNPYEDMEKSKFYRLIASGYAQVSFYEDLDFKTVFSPDILNTDEYQYWNRNHGNGPAYNGRYDRYHRNDLSYTSTNTLNYHHAFGLHHLNALAGMEYWQSTYETLYAGGRDLLGDFKELSVAGGSFSPESNTTKETLISYFGRAEYSYADKYNFSASLRTDGSSVFGADNKWGTFWSVGANWRISQEEFLQSAAGGVIDDLKLRASYGTSGNKSGLRRYASLGLWEASSDYKYGSTTGTGHYQLANNALSWEKQKMLNVGVDYGFWGRLYGSIDYFYKTSDGLLYDYPIAISNGFTSITMNAAKTANYGVELTVGGDILTGPVRWTADLNASLIRDKIKDLNGDDDVPMTEFQKIWSVGKSQYEFYMPTWAGVDPETGSPLWYTVDGNGNRTTTGTYTDAVSEKQGTSTPKVYGGFTNTLSYKQFSLSIQLNYTIGGKIFDGIYGSMMHDGSTLGVNMHKDALKAWTGAGQKTDVPAFSINNTTASNSLSTRFLYDATNIKVKRIQLSYSLPRNIPFVSKVISGGTVWAAADNLCTWFADKGYKGYDDIDIFGVQGYAQYSSIPSPRSFTFGINLTF